MDSEEKDRREIITNIQYIVYAIEEVYLSKILYKHCINTDENDN